MAWVKNAMVEDWRGVREDERLERLFAMSDQELVDTLLEKDRFWEFLRAFPNHLADMPLPTKIQKLAEEGLARRRAEAEAAGLPIPDDTLETIQ